MLKLPRLRDSAGKAALWDDHDMVVRVATVFSNLAPSKYAFLESGAGILLNDFANTIRR